MSPDEIKRQRKQRGWSQSDLAREMHRLADRELPSMDSLIRQIKRWEAGDHEPTEYYSDLLVETFTTGLVIDSELLDRLARSDLTQGQLEDTRAAVDGLCVSYTTNEPVDLFDETWTWLHRLDQARNGRITLDQHRQPLELTGWAALLAGNLAHDLNDPSTSTRARRLGLDAGHEVGHDRLMAWGHELAAWSLLGTGDYAAVIERAQAGQERAGRTDIGAHLTRHEAEAWAASATEGEAMRALERAAAITEDAPSPDIHGHHFQKDRINRRRSQ